MRRLLVTCTKRRQTRSELRLAHAAADWSACVERRSSGADRGGVAAAAEAAAAEASGQSPCKVVGTASKTTAQQ